MALCPRPVYQLDLLISLVTLFVPLVVLFLLLDPRPSSLVPRSLSSASWINGHTTRARLDVHKAWHADP